MQSSLSKIEKNQQQARMQMTAICPMTALILKAAARIYAKIKDSSGIEFPKPYVAGR